MLISWSDLSRKYSIHCDNLMAEVNIFTLKLLYGDYYYNVKKNYCEQYCFVNILD